MSGKVQAVVIPRVAACGQQPLTLAHMHGKPQIAPAACVSCTSVLMFLQEDMEQAISSVRRSTVDEMASWREPVKAAEAVVEAVQELRSSAAGIVATARASSSGGGFRARDGGWGSSGGAEGAGDSTATPGSIAADTSNAVDASGAAGAAESDAVPVTPMAAVRDMAFMTPRTSFTGGDQGTGQRSRRARGGRWAKEAAASPVEAKNPGSSAVAARRVSDVADVSTAGDASSGSKGRGSSVGLVLEKTPTPARNAAASIEERILSKIAAVCSPSIHRRAAAAISGGVSTDDVGGKPGWKE